MSGVEDLVAFLTRCLDHDERTAAAALADSSDEWFCPSETTVNLGSRPEEILTTAAIGWHISRFDPYRMLAEVKAKRAILAQIDGWPYINPSSTDASIALDIAAWPLLRLLAQPYAGQYGWDPRWSV